MGELNVARMALGMTEEGAREWWGMSRGEACKILEKHSINVDEYLKKRSLPKPKH